MSTVELEIAGSIARITLNRPEKLNAIDAPMLDAIEKAIDVAEKRSDVRVVLLTGNDALAMRLTKQAINHSLEIAGMRQALTEALEFDVCVETSDTPESRTFNAIMEKSGLKAAIDWRTGQLVDQNDKQEQR